MPSKFGKKTKLSHNDGPAADTRLAAAKLKQVRSRGGNTVTKALRLDHGNFSWASEGVTRKCRIAAVMFDASNSDHVRTNTIVKGAVVNVDSAPFALWCAETGGPEAGDSAVAEQLRESSRLLARITSRPGKCGRADGYILEGEELAFYLRKVYG